VVVIALLIVVIIVIGSDQRFGEFGYHHHFSRHRCHGFARQRHDGRDRRAGDDLAIG